MMNAAEARQATMERISEVAKEFIINCAAPAIEEAVKRGRFFVRPSFKGVINPAQTGPEVVKLLEDQGYEAKHVYYDGPNGYDNYILIKWEDK